MLNANEDNKFKIKLKEIFIISEKMYKSLELLKTYCESNLDDEGIYHISYNVEDLKNKSDIVLHKLADIISE